MASRGLIMWSDVQPTQEWIDNHIPEVSNLTMHFPLCVCVCVSVVKPLNKEHFGVIESTLYS